MSNDKNMNAADVLAVPICIGSQEKQPTNPALPTFYQTRLHLGESANRGNTVAFVFGNNSSDTAEQMAFAEKLVRAYNRDAAVAELIEAGQRALALLDDEDLGNYRSAEMLRAALARATGAQS